MMASDMKSVTQVLANVALTSSVHLCQVSMLRVMNLVWGDGPNVTNSECMRSRLCSAPITPSIHSIRIPIASLLSSKTKSRHFIALSPRGSLYKHKAIESSQGEKFFDDVTNINDKVFHFNVHPAEPSSEHGNPRLGVQAQNHPQLEGHRGERQHRLRQAHEVGGPAQGAKKTSA